MKPGWLVRSCDTTPSAIFFWAAVFVLAYGAGLLLRSVFPAFQPFGDTVILVALAGACFANFRCNRTFHCALTGPLFVVGAVAAGLIEANVLRLDMAIVWGVVVLGVVVAIVFEWRTLQGRQNVCSP